jgi:hypothetical protein
MDDDHFSQARRFSPQGFSLRGFSLQGFNLQGFSRGVPIYRGAAGKVVHADMRGNFIMHSPHQSGPSVIVTPC